MSFPLPFIKGNPVTLPKPEDITTAATSIPPKLSVLQSIFAAPEAFFEDSVKSATGMAIPPGPNRMLVSLMESIETSLPTLPTFALPIPGAPRPAPTPAKKEEGLVF